MIRAQIPAAHKAQFVFASGEFPNWEARFLFGGSQRAAERGCMQPQMWGACASAVDSPDWHCNMFQLELFPESEKNATLADIGDPVFHFQYRNLSLKRLAIISRMTHSAGSLCCLDYFFLSGLLTSPTTRVHFWNPRLLLSYWVFCHRFRFPERIPRSIGQNVHSTPSDVCTPLLYPIGCSPYRLMCLFGLGIRTGG